MNFTTIKKIKGKGRGLVASWSILKGTILENAPVLIVPESEMKFLKKTSVINYSFLWNKSGANALVLSQSSLLNHSDEPNIDYTINRRDKTISFKAIRDIQKGEELTIDYGETWFDVKS